MNARATKAATITAAVAIAAALLAYPGILSVAAAANPSISSSSSSNIPSTTSATTGHPGPWAQGRGGHPGAAPGGRGGWTASHYRSAVNLSVGQTITVTSTQGDYRVVGNPGQNGTASGTLTFTVTSKLSGGYALSITGGSIVVAGTTYTVSSGSAEMGPSANAMVGQGATTPAGQFLLHAQARGSFAGNSGFVSLDFTNGTTEYAVMLAGTIQA